MSNEEDLVTSKLGALHLYQLAIPPPVPPEGSFDQTAARRGESLFTSKAPDNRYRTAPLRGIWTRIEGPGFYHDGRFPDLRAVIDHYDDHRDLNLPETEKADLVEYLKSL